MKIIYNSEEMEIPTGTTIKEALKEEIEKSEVPIIGAKYNNEYQRLDYVLEKDGEVALVNIASQGGMKIYKIMIYVILSGIATGIGALIGVIIGKISQKIIAICLSFAAGAMLYIVSGELIPESNKLYEGRIVALGNIIGIIIGIVVTKIQNNYCKKQLNIVKYKHTFEKQKGKYNGRNTKRIK